MCATKKFTNSVYDMLAKQKHNLQTPSADLRVPFGMHSDVLKL